MCHAGFEWRAEVPGSAIPTTVGMRYGRLGHGTELMSRGLPPPLTHFLLETTTMPRAYEIVFNGLDLSREHHTIFQTI